MSNHRNPRPSLSRPFPDKFDPTASRDREACTEADIEAIRSGKKHKQTLARLYALVSKTSSKANAALERGEELVALRDAHLAAQAAKRSPARRAR